VAERKSKNLRAGKIICAGKKGGIISGYRDLFWCVSFNSRSQRLILARGDLFSLAEIHSRSQRFILARKDLFSLAEIYSRSRRFILVRKDLFSRAKILRRRQEKKATHKECVAFVSSENRPFVFIYAR
jgi:hypothetical protein